MDCHASPTSARYGRPSEVFCSRKLEDGLADLVRHKAECGIFPTDEELKERGKVILGLERTAAEEPALLEKFKRMMEAELGVTWGSSAGQGPSTSGSAVGIGAVAGPAAGLGMSGLGAAVMEVEGGVALGSGMSGMGELEMGDMTGLDMGMDLSGDLDNALMQDLNFDFVFDAQDDMTGASTG